ncbi:uncharacterized protein LOC117301553 [Asterias rubens]|uniref:uncharacterized protein LOC117301553 n=1 Tax=Asterias rubens TaxID=7604 RepID=UPI001455BF2E|nr:uncharacterized protein LOC117301553 [Asterias rubens]
MGTVNPSETHPKSGRIISHNLHLLNDSYGDDQETGSVPSSKQDNSPLRKNGMLKTDQPAMEVNNNMGQYGEETPGGAQPNTDAGYPDQFRDSLEDGDNRPASNSSAGSRGMDDSPVENSKRSIKAEKQYQEDLRERVKQSFADLGLEPEGILKDGLEEESKRPQRKRKTKNSEGRSAPGSSGTEHGSQSDQDDDTEPDYDANKPDKYANEDGNPNDREQGLEDETTPRGYPEDSGLRHDEDRLADSNPNGGYPDQGNYEDDKTPRAYPDQEADESRLQEDYPEYGNEDNYSAAHEAPARYSEENEGYENNDAPPSHPENYPNEGRYDNNPENDGPYSSYQDQDNNGYGAQPDEERNPDEGSYPNEGSYPDTKQERYPEQDSYPEQGSYPGEDSNPIQDRYPEQNSYPEQGGYPDGDSYPKQDGYPEPDNYPEQGSYPEESGYEPNEKDPEDVPAPSYPSRYDNQESDEDQYDDRNPPQDRAHEDQSSGDEPRTGRYDQTPKDTGRYDQQTPKDSGRYDEIPRDSLDADHPGAQNDDAPTDSLEYDYEPKDEPYNPQEFHNNTEPEPQDSLDFGYSKPAPEPSQPKDQAPYDSLDEEEPPVVPNQIAPREAIEPVNELQRDSPNFPRPAVPSTQSNNVQHVQRGGSDSNNSSAKSNRDPNGSSAGSSVRSNKQSPEPRSLPPSGKRRPSSGSRGQHQNSRQSKPQGYSNRETRKSSANKTGSAESDRSRPNSRPQAGSSSQLGSQVSLSSNRSRLQGNRAKASPIPAHELSAKELLKRTRSKGPDGLTDRPKFEHSDSQLIKKNGEDVRVSYISDDSGDEGEHFLDEKGSPVDQFGKPLYKDLHGGKKKPEEPKFEFRIKPTPPKQKSPLELQSVNARRTSADAGSPKRIPIGGKITVAKPFPVDEPTIEKTEEAQTGGLDGALPPRQDSPEIIPQKTEVQPEGINESTLPPRLREASTQKQVQETPANSASNSRTPFGDVTLRSVGTGMSARPYGRGGSRLESGTTKDDSYKDLRFESEGAAAHGRENKASIEEAINKDLETGEKKSYQPRTSTRDTTRQVPSGVPLSGTYNKKDFEKKQEIPPASRGPSGASYTERGIQYTPQEAQRREPEPAAIPQYLENVPQDGYQIQQQYENQQQAYYPNDQSDYSQPGGFPNAPQQYHQEEFQGQPNWEAQQQQGAPWNTGHQPQQVQQPFYNKGQPPQQRGHNPQEGYYNQQGYDAPIGRPNIPQPDQGREYYGQQGPYPENYQSAPPHGRPAVPHSGYMSPSQGGGPPTNRFYPNQGTQPQAGYYPNQIQPVHNEPPPSNKQRPPPKPKPNFIDMNKANLARGPPRKRYSDIQKKVTPPIRANPKKPLPNISRENSLDDPWGEQSYNQGSAHTWSQENWTRQLVQQQQHLPLRRGHSDTNLYTQTQNYGPGPIPQGYQPAGAPLPNNIPYNDPGYSQDPRVNQPAYNQTFPPQMPRYQNGQVYSYSADHATHYARNNGHPQMSGPPRTRVAFADDPQNSFDSDVNPMVFANEGAGVPFQHGIQRTSPYAVLPDIPGQHNSDGTSELRKSDPDGYAARLLKQKQPPQYKQYTIKDYRNLKSDIKLGGLGPDPELVSEKQDKVNRQRDYAKTVMQQNKKQLQQTKRLWPNAPTVPREESPSKREVAKEYSKNIPKPRLPTPPEVLHERMYGASSRQHEQQQYEEAVHSERSISEMRNLAELRARHEKEKQEVEKLRRDPSKT